MRKRSYIERLECVAVYVRSSGQIPRNPDSRVSKVVRTKRAEGKVKELRRELQRLDSLIAHTPTDQELIEQRAAVNEEFEHYVHRMQDLR